MTSLEELDRKLDGLLREPDNPRLYNEIGVALYHAKDVENARLYFERAYELCPGDGDSLYNVALLLYSGFEFEKAGAALQAAMELCGDCTDILKMAADCFYQLGEYELAANYLNQSIELDTKQG